MGKIKQALQAWAARFGLAAAGTASELAETALEQEPEPENPRTGFDLKRFILDVWTLIKEKQIAFLSAGVAFYGMLSLIPGLVALLSLYGLIADPADVRSFVDGFSNATPREVSALIRSQLETITGTSAGSLGLGLGLSLAAVIWTASSASQALVRGVNLIHDLAESRSAIRLRLLALALTIGLLALVTLSIAALTILPGLASGTLGRLLTWVRWPALAAGGFGALTILYHIAPGASRHLQLRRSGLGAAIGILVWLLGSGIFALYADNFASYNETYGALGAVIVVLLWLYISGFAILLGAAIDRAAAAQSRHP